MVRHKNRYIVVEIQRKGDVKKFHLHQNQNEFCKVIMDKLEQLHGDFGVAACRTGFVAKYCNKETHVAVVRARHGPHKLITTTLPLIQSVEKKKAKICILYTGATLKKCFQFLRKHQEKKVELLCANLKTVEKKENMKKKIMNLNSFSAFSGSGFADNL